MSASSTYSPALLLGEAAGSGCPHTASESPESLLRCRCCAAVFDVCLPPRELTTLVPALPLALALPLSAEGVPSVSLPSDSST